MQYVVIFPPLLLIFLGPFYDHSLQFLKSFFIVLQITLQQMDNALRDINEVFPLVMSLLMRLSLMLQMIFHVNNGLMVLL